LILEEGMNVRVVILPAPEDPDSYVRKVGAEAFQKYIQENKKDLILFKTSLFATEAKADPIKKAELIRDIVESIAKIPDAIQRSVYVKESSQLFDMSEQILITEVNKSRRKKQGEQQKEEEKQQQKEQQKSDEILTASAHTQNLENPSNLHVLEHDIIRILLEFGAWNTQSDEQEISVVHYVLDELEGLEIETPKYKVIYDLIKKDFADGAVHDENFFSANDDEQIRNLAIDILTQPYTLSENWWLKYKVAVTEKKDRFVKDIHSTIIRFKQFKNIAELRKIEKLLKDAKDDGEQLRLIKLHKLLMEQKKEFAKTVGNVIYRPYT
jgi:DNA primase